MKKLLFVVPIILLASAFFAIPRLLKIQNVECKSQYGPCSDQLTDSLISNKGNTYYSAKKNITKTLSDTKDVSQYSIRFIFPSTFLVEVIESKPIVAFKYQDKFYLVDKQGVVLSVTDKNNLPIVNVANFNPNFVINEKTDDEIIFVANAMNKAYLVYNIVEANMTENEFSFILPTGKTIIFPTLGDEDTLFGSLQIILSRLNSEANYSIIDLRYKNPVLR